LNGRKGSTVTCTVEEDKFLEFWKRRATGTKDFKARDEARRYGGEDIRYTRRQRGTGHITKEKAPGPDGITNEHIF